jgi:signal transduction histidine kinase/ligand-binding sensor domain-containing protein
LVSYREHRFRRLATAETLPDGKNVSHLAASRNGGIWLHAGGSVARLENGKFSRPWVVQPAVWSRILSLHEADDGSLNIVREDAWLTLSPRAEELRTNFTAAPSFDFWLWGLPANPPGSFVAGTVAGKATGLHRWEQGDWTAVGKEELGSRALDFIFEDRASNLWVNARPGELYRWDRKHWTHIDLGDHFAPAPVTCMEEDREGSLWAGTEQGLVQLQPRRVRAYTTRDGLVDDFVWSVCEGNDGTIWVGADRGLSRIQNGRVVPFSEVEPATWEHDIDRCVWPARDGGVWIAKSGLGVLKFRDRFSQWVAPENLPSPSIAALYEDRSGRLWIGTGTGVAVFENGRVTAYYTNWAGRAGYDVRCILEDRAGTFWFGTQGQGLTRLRDGRFEVFTTHDGLSSDRIWSLHEDAERVVWIGTENGLNRFEPPGTGKSGKQKAESRKGESRFFNFTTRHGLRENAVNCVLEDDFGYLWLSGLRGIYRVQREQLNAVAEGRVATVECAAFGTADGMESSETNGETQPAGWKARDGRLWFPTTRGVVVIDPKAIPANEPPPPVLVEQVKADEEVVFGDGGKAEVGGQKAQAGGQRSESHFQLRAGHGHVVEFRYTANTFVASERARFRYRLVGANRDWREETSERTARYINLKPGKYRFEVTAVDHHGIWNPVPASFGFSLVPRFWQTWTFYVLCGSGVIGLAAGLQAYRLRWQRRLLKLEEQRALATERTRIARDLHDDLGTALTGLALELDVAGRQAKEVAPLAGRLSEAAQRTRDLAERMREVVWTVNPKCDTVSSLASFLEQQVSQFLKADGLRLRLDFPEDIPELPMGAEARHELALSVREALTNVVRHAQATEVTLSLAITDQTLRVQVKDNGRGFRQCQTNVHGLANMKARMERVRGSFECLCAPDGGTAVTFRLPLGQPAKQLAPNEA